MRTAIEPLDAIGRNDCDAAADALGSALAVAEADAVALEAGLTDGTGPPHAATATSATQPRIATRLID